LSPFIEYVVKVKFFEQVVLDVATKIILCMARMRAKLYVIASLYFTNNPTQWPYDLIAAGSTIEPGIKVPCRIVPALLYGNEIFG